MVKNHFEIDEELFSLIQKNSKLSDIQELFLTKNNFNSLEKNQLNKVFPDWFLSFFQLIKEKNLFINIYQLSFLIKDKYDNPFEKSPTPLYYKDNYVYYIASHKIFSGCFLKFVVQGNNVYFKVNNSKNRFFKITKFNNEIMLEELRYKKNVSTLIYSIEKGDIYYKNYYPNNDIKKELFYIKNSLFDFKVIDYTLTGNISKVSYYKENFNNSDFVNKNTYKEDEDYIVEVKDLFLNSQIKGMNQNEWIKDSIEELENITERELFLIELNFS